MASCSHIEIKDEQDFTTNKCSTEMSIVNLDGGNEKKSPPNRKIRKRKLLSEKNNKSIPAQDVQNLCKRKRLSPDHTSFQNFEQLCHHYKTWQLLQPVFKLKIDLMLLVLGSKRFNDTEVFQWILSSVRTKSTQFTPRFDKQFNTYRKMYDLFIQESTKTQLDWLEELSHINYCTPFKYKGWRIIFGNISPPQFCLKLKLFSENADIKQNCEDVKPSNLFVKNESITPHIESVNSEEIDSRATSKRNASRNVVYYPKLKTINKMQTSKYPLDINKINNFKVAVLKDQNPKMYKMFQRKDLIIFHKDKTINKLKCELLKKKNEILSLKKTFSRMKNLKKKIDILENNLQSLSKLKRSDVKKGFHETQFCESTNTEISLNEGQNVNNLNRVFDGKLDTSKGVPGSLVGNCSITNEQKNSSFKIERKTPFDDLSENSTAEPKVCHLREGEYQVEILHLKDEIKENEFKLELYEREIKILQDNLSVNEGALTHQLDVNNDLQEKFKDAKQIEKISKGTNTEGLEDFFIKDFQANQLLQPKSNCGNTDMAILNIDAKLLINKFASVELDLAELKKTSDAKCLELENENDISEMSLENIILKNSELVSEIAGLKSCISKLESSNAKLSEEVSYLESELVKKDEQLSEKIVNLSSVNNTLQNTNEEFFHIQEEFDHLKNSLLSLRKELGLVDVNPNRTYTLHEELKAIEGLKHELLEINKQCHKSVKQASAKKKYVSLLLSMVNRFKKDKYLLQKKSKSLKKLITDLKNNLGGLQEDVQNVKREYSEMNANAMHSQSACYVSELEDRCRMYAQRLKEEYFESSRQLELQLAMYCSTADRYREQQKRILDHLPVDELS